MGKKRGLKHEYNVRKEIEHRIGRAENVKAVVEQEKIDHISKEYKEKSIARAREFMNLNVAESKLDGREKALRQKIVQIEEEIVDVEKQRKKIKQLRKDLGFEHETVITEHALLRYIERFLGIDIDKAYNEILKLPKKDITKYGNTIVTVYPIGEPKVIIEDIAEQEAGVIPRKGIKSNEV